MNHTFDCRSSKQTGRQCKLEFIHCTSLHCDLYSDVVHMNDVNAQMKT